MQSKITELSGLVSRLTQNGGFQVYVHAMERADLNDWKPEEIEYVRALHNIKQEPGPNQVRGSELLLYINARAHSACGGRSHLDEKKPKGVAVVSYGMLPKREIKTEVTTRYVHGQIPCKGIKGLFGCTKPGIIGEEKGEMKVDHFDLDTPEQLSNLVYTDSREDAYFVRLEIGGLICEGGKSGRYSPNYPTLTIVAGKELIEETVRYLKENPANYMECVRTMLPKDKYPNVNKGILGSVGNYSKFLFLNADKIPKNRSRSTSISFGLEKWVYDEFGENVEVK